MPSRKRARKSRKPPIDSQPSSSKTSTAITLAEADRQGLSDNVTSGTGLETQLEQLTLQARLNLTQAQIVAPDLGREGHNYESSVVKENARAHLGDVHNVYNFNQPSAHVPADSGGSDLMGALSFDGMSDRPTSVTPAYAETCSWIFNRPEYLRWRDPSQQSSHHGVLWIKGNAGTGKSTLMSCLYDHVSSMHCDEAVVTFFFNARSPNRLVKSTEGMYRCILHQCLHRLPRLKESLSHIQIPRSKQEAWPVEQLEHAFRRVVLNLATNERVTCFVDALDECDIKDVRRAIEFLEDLAESVTRKSIQFRICFSSRYYPQITMRHHEELKLDLQPEHMQDISMYINNKLAVSAKAKLELSPKIYDRCSGTFLWVVLVVKRLREKSDSGSTRSQLLSVLDSIPQELQDLFAAIVAEPDDALISIVQWKLFSRSELGIKQLYFAVKTSIGDATRAYHDPEEIDFEGMKRYLLHASRGLLEYKSFRLNFIHESVREYFLNGGLANLDHTSPHQTSAVGHSKLAEGCVSYLELAGDESVFADFCNPQDHSRRKDAICGLPLVGYASAYIFFHAEIAFSHGMIELALLERLPIQFSSQLLYRQSQPYDPGPKPVLSSWLLSYLLEQNCYELARALLEQPSKPSGCTTGQCSTSGTPCVHTRLNKPDLSVVHEDWRFDPLSLAIFCGRAGLVELLLDRGADVNMKAGEWGSIICLAVAEGHCQIVRMLFQYGARLSTADTTAVIPNAAGYASAGMVRYLLEKGADVNGTDGFSRTALHDIVWRFHHEEGYEIAKILVDAGANMEAVDDAGDTALFSAVEFGDADFVQFLLQNNANVHARSRSSLTILHIAANNHSNDAISIRPETLQILQTILDAGADINSEGGPYGTALNAACMAGNLELVIFLLDRGAVFTPRGDEFDSSIAEYLSTARRKWQEACA